MASGTRSELIIPPEARRDILVGAWEEDAVFDVLRLLKDGFGATDAHWLVAIRQEAMLGNLEIYRYPVDRSGFDRVDAATLSLTRIGTDYGDAAYLTRTQSTLSVISSLPPPPLGDPRWIIGLWGFPEDS